MRKQATLLAGLAVFLVGCGADGPTEPRVQAIDATSADARTVVAQASGGASWVLEVFGFVIPQTLGFSARKYADGTVRGHINYQQTFEGETFHFNATVTCMNVYDGNRVKYGGEVIVSNDPTIPVGTFMWFQGIDNGEGNAAAPDQSTGSGFGDDADNEAFCDSPNEPNPLFLAGVDGNIQVRG